MKYLERKEHMEEKNAFTAVNMLIRTNRMHKRLLDSTVCANIGLHRTQHIILMHLAKEKFLTSQKALAEHLNITAAAVTGALKKLEAGGYIERKAVCGDNRYNEITITELGRRVVEDSRAMFQKIDKSLFEDFSDVEILEFIGYLEKIQNNILKEEK